MRSIAYPSCALALALAAAAPAAAADRDLLDMLLENGSITEAQHAELLAPDAGDAGAVAAASGSKTAAPRAGGNGIEVELLGRLHVDYARHGGDAAGGLPAVNATEVRRGRIGVDGTLPGDWDFVAEVDFARNDVSVKDFALAYTGFERVDLFVGHQKQPYSLAVEMSSNDMPFVERGIDNGLIIPFVDRAVGVRVESRGDKWFAAAGLYGEAINSSSNNDEGWGTAGRFVYTPLLEQDRVLHVAARLAYREPGDGSPGVRMRDETTDFSSISIVDTGVLAGADSVTLLGPEAAYARGAWSVVAEYNDARVARTGAPDLDFDSWHVGATYSLGGTSRAAAYRLGSGEFKGLDPQRPFARGDGGGDWEISARYSSIDLNDGAFAGGSEEAVTLGANWYASRNVRFLLSWTRIIDTDGSSARRVAADGLDIATVRAQFVF